MSNGDITGLLERARAGDTEASEALGPLVYDHLRSLARARRMRWRGDSTLGVTALVHEAYAKLVSSEAARFDSRDHFFAVASKAMRQILVNYASQRRAAKRGAGSTPETLDEGMVADAQTRDQLDLVLAVDEALTSLADLSPRQAKLVEYKFFGGLTDEEAAELLEVSDRTVRRDWIRARAWLQIALDDGHRDTLDRTAGL